MLVDVLYKKSNIKIIIIEKIKYYYKKNSDFYIISFKKRKTSIFNKF